MVDPTTHSNQIETRKDLKQGSGKAADDAALWAYWMGQEKIAEKEERKWIKRSREIVKRYRDERPENQNDISRFNILWSNVQTLIPTLYARTPKPDVERRFRDQDPVARLAATLMERCLSYSLDTDAFDFDEVMEAVVEDRLLPGRGTARVLYVPHYGEVIQEKPEAEGETTLDAAQAQGAVVDTKGDAEPSATDAKLQADPNAPREVVYEETRAQYVFWEDYREGPARRWHEVPWVRYRAYLSKDELVARFGKQKADQVKLDYEPKGIAESAKTEPPPDLFKKAIIHETWDKSETEVVWYAPGTDDVILDKKDDPLRLPGFFPNPDPLFSTTTTDKRIPVPDYIEYQDQARELDKITARISILTAALKVRGVYPGENKQELQQLFDDGTDNRLIPVSDWLRWADKGGLDKIIQWVPIQQVAEVLVQLYNARDRVKALLYEATGLSDILRGQTNPEETKGAQELKANFASRRISPQQKKVAKFARNLLRLMGAVIAEHFSKETISKITNYPQLDPVPPLPPQPQAPMQRPMMIPGAGMGPAPQGQAVAASPPNSPAGAGPMPPQQPDPQMQAYQQAMTQWQQQAQQVQAVQAKNAQKQQEFEAACALIREDGVHGFRIDIEADSTIMPDEQAEKQARVEFLQQMVPMLETVVPIAQGNPPLAAVAKEIVLFAMRGFRVARQLEETMEQAFDALAQMPPNPKMTGADKAKGSTSNVDSPADLALRGKETDAKLQIAREKSMVDMRKIASQEEIEKEKLAQERGDKVAKLSLAQQKLDDERAFRATKTLSVESREAERLT